MLQLNVVSTGPSPGSKCTIDPSLRLPNDNKCEKQLLREAFRCEYLPEEVLWRRKEAFSDGISSEDKSWHSVIRDFVDKFVTDQDFLLNAKNYTHCTPKTKEAYFYRKIFDELFGNKYSNVIPEMWMPNWSDATDPSARELKNLYNNSETEKSISVLSAV